MSCCSLWGQDTDGGSPRDIHCCVLSWRLPFWNPDLAPSKSLKAPVMGCLRSNKLQGGNIAPPTPQQTGCLKSFWATQQHLSTPVDIALPTKGQDTPPPTSDQAPVPPTEKPTQTPGSTLATRGKTPEVRGATFLKPAKWKMRQNERTEKYVSDERTR